MRRPLIVRTAIARTAIVRTARTWAAIAPTAVALAAISLSSPSYVGAQTAPIGDAAEAARRAWHAHAVDSLVANSPRVLIQLPGADPSAALSQKQAAALLRDYLQQGEEVETRVRAAKTTGEDLGFVELERRYRVAGTQEIRSQSVLLGYRWIRRGWGVVELRVVE